MKAEDDLILKSAGLAHAAPEEWKAFVASMKAVSFEWMTNCVRSPVDALQVNQGRAQQAALLADLFEGAVKAADRIVERRAEAKR